MSRPSLLLIPQPRFLKMGASSISLADQGSIMIQAAEPHMLWFTAQQLQGALKNYAGVSYALRAAGTASICLNVVPGSVRHDQGYELTIQDDRIYVVASTPKGCFYGVQTLMQIIKQAGRELPELRISDWPDYLNRGVMLDISRDRVPTMETLYQLVDMLASWKVNQFQLYTEHTFAFQNHEVVWEKASPMTGEEILALDSYCRDRFVELVPNQNVFGHMHRWLAHDGYQHLAEAPDGAQTPWGYFNLESFSISPVVPESLELVREMLDELLPHFSSGQVNVGCDETYDVGQGRSKKLADEIGADRVYLEFLLKIYSETQSRGKVMQFWGDIIMEHPHLVPKLPRDAIALEWGYEADHPFEKHSGLFAASGIPFYVCPGTSSWRTLAGRTDNALGNLRNAAENGLKYGAVGYLITDWGDEGHWQPLPVSYLGFVYGASVSWGYENNCDIPIKDVLNYFVFQDRANVMGRLIYDLGNIYQQPGIFIDNSSVLFHILNASLDEIAQYKDQAEQHIDSLEHTYAAIDQIIATIDDADMGISNPRFVQRELVWVARMLQHACRRGIWALKKACDINDFDAGRHLLKDADKLIAEYEELWHTRSRPGGFVDSVARMHKMRSAYK